ncbi:MAG TPA: tRNA (adenosine(37)-N6)-threonylcarbamoyltransferase complex ATPase subunit type 1 TsaE [Caulobacteraceae bacterium]|nr:tRNA (adenosine(37)-N6)-threonylcarbamoyltransferase complex ATPase subunit type 1 TsaE [Caulobacteraceae bacterium]
MIVAAEGDFRLDDAAATERLGRAIARTLKACEAVCLKGVLGAGKTTLARALIRARTTEEEEVPSPTFTLVQFYEGKGLKLAHFDLYRLERPEEADEIGLEEALRDAAVVIEWPERLGRSLPRDRLDIELTIVGEPGRDESRLARLNPHGAWEGRPLEF